MRVVSISVIPSLTDQKRARAVFVKTTELFVPDYRISLRTPTWPTTTREDRGGGSAAFHILFGPARSPQDRLAARTIR